MAFEDTVNPLRRNPLGLAAINQRLSLGPASAMTGGAAPAPGSSTGVLAGTGAAEGGALPAGFVNPMGSTMGTAVGEGGTGYSGPPMSGTWASGDLAPTTTGGLTMGGSVGEGGIGYSGPGMPAGANWAAGEIFGDAPTNIGSGSAPGAKGSGPADFGPGAPTLNYGGGAAGPLAPSTAALLGLSAGATLPQGNSAGSAEFDAVMQRLAAASGAAGSGGLVPPSMAPHSFAPGAGTTPAGGPTPTPADMTGLPELNTDFSAASQQAQQAVYDKVVRQMQPQVDQARRALEQRLANQGIPIGSEAYTSEMDRFERGVNESLERAALDAVMAGNAEAGRLFGQGVTARGMLGGERERGADRAFAQAMGIAGLGLQRYLGDLGAATSRYGIDTGAATSRYGIDTSRRTTMDTAGLQAQLRLRELGLSEDNMSFQQLIQLIAASRAGLTSPQFGGAAPLDVSGALGLSQSAAQRSALTDAQRRAGMFNLGATLLGGLFR